MEHIDLGRLTGLVGGELVSGDPGSLIGPDVVTDSRAVTAGCLFVAFEGERVDGHEYVAQATASGAAAALVARRVDADLPQVVVDDTTLALGALARGVVAAAKRAGLVVVGITGSSGKTSTKDLVAQVLETSGPTVAPVGSFNNEIGAPLTALKVNAATRFLVSEMGSRGVGHVESLCAITPPSIGVIINVGHAHLGEFGSQANIALAKGELVEALAADGLAVLNADDALVAAMASRTDARVASFSVVGDPGSASALRVWASDITPDELQRFAFTLNVAGEAGGSAPVHLQVLGDHNVSNALAAAAVGLGVGLTVTEIAAALSSAISRSKWRMQLQERGDGLAVLNDSYNANPDSMAAALRTLSKLRRSGGRLVAVLGDMLELGESAPEAHAEAGRLAGAAGVDVLVALGDHGLDLLRGFAGSGRDGRYFSDKEAATAHVAHLVGGRDVVLVKASRGLALESVADGLLTEGASK